MKHRIIISILIPAALGYGLVAVTLPRPAPVEPAAFACGTEGEDPRRCSREGLQMIEDERGSGRLG